MIPLKLQLKNFLSYGPSLQTIDFTPYPLICLSGKNGHGKSALLDAITWSIWGQARKISGVSKADAHLLRLGQHQMLVVFDFEFNGQHYRIRREFAVTHGKQYASLDFGLVQENKMISLTNKTIRETQAIIEKTIGLDFESFINSAFLRQGQSNEFSKKSPKERKEILGTILGLTHYETIRKRAVDKVKQATTEIMHLTKFQEKLEVELQKIPELSAALATIKQKLEHAMQHEKSILQQQNKNLQDKDAYAAQKNQQTMLQIQYDQKKAEEEQLKKQLLDQYHAWKKVHKNSTMHTQSTHDYEREKQLLLQKITEQQQLFQKSLELKEQILSCKQQEQNLVLRIKNEYQKKIQEQELSCTTYHNNITVKNNELAQIEKQQQEGSTQIEEFRKEIQLIEATIKTHTNKKESQEIEKQFEKRKMVYHQWVAHVQLLKTEIESLLQKQNMTHDENNPSCPLCEQNLSASRKKFLKGQFSKQEDFHRHRLQRLTVALKSLKELLLAQHADLQTLKKNDEQKKIAEITLEEFYKSEQKLVAQQTIFTQNHTTLSSELRDLQKKLLNEQQMLQTLQKQEQRCLEEDAEYTMMHSKLVALDALQAATLFDQHSYQQLLDQLHLVEQQKAHSQEIQQELLKQQERIENVQKLCKTIKTLKKSCSEVEDQLKKFDYLGELAKKIMQHEQQITQALSTIKQEREILLHQKGSLENEFSKLSERELEHKFQQTKIKELKYLSDDYQIIATAVSKDGIQALIIEEALPEIEHEANVLLSQLTNNQAHIIIESLRDLKKGGTKETLDIKISDAVGIRPYELFSGGEAFRIDFALRLAISKLLARRAGTSLQTLIIDEGFGSQDDEGLTHIMDSLYKIQDNFCKIIIVSHLASMKDQFPVHFYVEKGSQGSTVKVIEQG